MKASLMVPAIPEYIESKCSNCGFYRNSECRAVLPIIMLGNSYGQWPKVGPDDWCGKHTFIGSGVPPKWFHQLLVPETNQIRPVFVHDKTGKLVRK